MMETAIRAATVDDAETVARLIRDHAAYEDAHHLCRTTAADIRRDGFGPKPLFEVLLAEHDGTALGFAMYLEVFSSWEGRAILVLEDLYVTESARGDGLGRRLMAEVAAITLARGCPRLDWVVTDGNPARGFYRYLGGDHIETWLTYRLDGAALQALADEAD